MADGTRHHAQLADTVSSLKGETVYLPEEQDKQKQMLEVVLQQLNNLAASYDQLAILVRNHHSGEGSSHKQVSNNPLFEGGGGIHARSMRLEFPKFDGTKPMEWVLKAQQFFAYFSTPADQKLQIAFFHMEGKALSWYCWLMESGPVNSWDDFISALEVRFGSSAFEDPVGEFTKLRQNGTVEEYQTQFEILSNKINGLTEEFRISTFLSGLKDELRIMVTMFKPSTLSAAFGLARLQEEEVIRRIKGVPNEYPAYQNTNPNNQPRLPVPAPMLRLPDPPNRPNPSPAPLYPPGKNSFPIKRISPTQMQERKEKGLCYFCDEKFYPGHRCNKPRIYLLEGMEREGEEEKEEKDHEEGSLAVIMGNGRELPNWMPPQPG